jgi:hypothetical protein
VRATVVSAGSEGQSESEGREREGVGTYVESKRLEEWMDVGCARYKKDGWMDG